MRLIAIGEILWDVFPDDERIGGAPFNLAVQARRLGHDVAFISAVGRDLRGEAALRAVQARGLDSRWISRHSRLPTGIVAVQLASGEPRYEIVQPAAYQEPELSPASWAALADVPPDFICFGTLAQAAPAVRRLTRRLRQAFPQARGFYDINLRSGFEEPRLVRELMAGTQILKCNAEEARRLPGLLELPLTAPVWDDAAPARMRAQAAAYAAALRSVLALELVSITLGACGCALATAVESAAAPAAAGEISNPVGAGDAFSAGLLHAWHQGWKLSEVARCAGQTAVEQCGIDGRGR